jgi:RNA polymerase sigma-70 factor (ECF subfamily)
MPVDENQLNQRLSQITTHWSQVLQAHQGEADAAVAAQYALLHRYGGAVYRYLLGALGDPDAALEAAQEFACCFLRGDFRQVGPDRGRFRDYVRAVLIHLVAHHHRQKAKQARVAPLPAEASDSTAPAWKESDNQEFLNRWRDELLDRAWKELERLQQSTGQPLFTVLRFRAEHPQMRSAQMAGEVGARLGKALTAAGVRQMLHRAREKYAELLVQEVGRSLQTSDRQQIEQELSDLGLLIYCQRALE